MKEHEPLRRLLRDALDPGLADDAARRIADGAWDRAAAIRAAPAPPGTRPRRWGWAAAAAVLIGAVALVAKPIGPAFAVEGDPVKVYDDGRWTDTRRVTIGSWVFVPAGDRTIRARDGSEIDPRPGAVFRVVSGHSPLAAWRVEIRSGDAEVAGRSIVLDLANAMQVSRADPADPGSGSREVLRVSASAGPALADPPLRLDALHASFSPTVSVVRGAARVANLKAPEFALVRARETLAWVNSGDSGLAEPRLVHAIAWSPQVALDVVSGANVVGGTVRGDGGMILTLRAPGGNLSAVQVPGQLREDALAHMTLLTAERAAREARGEGAPSWTADLRLPRIEAGSWRRYEAARDGASTAVTIYGDGTVSLEQKGRAPRTFPSVAALRAAAPEAAALFGESLDR